MEKRFGRRQSSAVVVGLVRVDPGNVFGRLSVALVQGFETDCVVGQLVEPDFFAWSCLDLRKMLVDQPFKPTFDVVEIKPDSTQAQFRINRRDRL